MKYIWAIFITLDNKVSANNNYIFSKDSLSLIRDRIINSNKKIDIVVTYLISSYKSIDGFHLLNSNWDGYKIVQKLRDIIPYDTYIIPDICLDAHINSGFCYLPDKDGLIDIELTNNAYKIIAENYINNGADGLGLSSSINNQYEFIYSSLKDKCIYMNYTVKYSSVYYRAFRTVTDIPDKNIKRDHQLDLSTDIDSIVRKISNMNDNVIHVFKPSTLSLDILAIVSNKLNKKYKFAIYHTLSELESCLYLSDKYKQSIDDYLNELYFVFNRAGANYIISYYI